MVQKSNTVNILDHDELLERCGGNATLAHRLLDRFIAISGDEHATLSTAVNQRDLETVRRVAHRVKGSAYTISARRAGNVAAEIEVGCRDPEWTALESLVAQLEDCRAELRVAIGKESPESEAITA